jgi:hypothetical protein
MILEQDPIGPNQTPRPLNLHASTLMVEAEYSSETPVSIYKNTRQQDPETIITVNT